MMKTLRTTLSATILIAAFTQPASATIIDDTYWGSENHGWGDRIGNHTTTGGGYTFEVHNMDITLTGTMLNVKINTNYAGHTGLYGTGYGDLFLSSSWDVFGSAPYAADNNATGTNWSYGLSLDGDTYTSNGALVKSGSTRFTSNAGGTTTLYELNGSNNDDAFLSDDLTSGTFRNGQEVVVDLSSNTVINTGNSGTWGISALDTDDFISFSIDLAGTTLLNSDTIALHWGMTCGNDTIEGAFSRVPEPAILSLLAVGLISAGVIRHKKA
ncbi:MAG TPA: PEP-CTERM sorting domain-containing protein [Gammaproteobacteria bacterium]|nr:PEP-CTERM sorting domain-containing protein [Gammaproteobacteria bacterium]